MLIGAVEDGDDVAASELQLTGLLRSEVIQRLHQHLEPIQTTIQTLADVLNAFVFCISI